MVSNHQGVFILRKIFTALCLLVCATVFYLYQTNPGNITQKFSIRPASAHRLYPSNWTLINLKRFEFLLNSDVCGNKDEVGNNPLLLIIVTSHPGHVSLRQAFRNSLSSRILRQFGVRRMFLLGRINPFQENYSQVDQSVVETEHQQYGDIAQGDFVESYKNLSYKHIMGLKHAVNFCPHTKYVLKMDDDIAVDIFQLLAHIKPNNISGLALAGAVMTGQELHPLRDRSSKWFVSREEYALESYPPFVSGWAYVTSITAAKELVERSESSPYFWIDDVYVTGLLANLSDFRFNDFRSRLTIFSDHLRCCLKNNHTACDYFVGPVGDDVKLLEEFYRQALKCYLKSCPDYHQQMASRCVITKNSQLSTNLNNGRVIYGQVIPISR